MATTWTMPAPYHAKVAARANDRLKVRWGYWLWGGIGSAAVLHFALLAYFPEMNPADVSIRSEVMDQVNVTTQKDFEVPPPPQEIARPAIPVLSTSAKISDDVTIGEVVFKANPVATLPPPPTDVGTTSLEEAPVFTPYEVKPELRNRDEYARALQQRYPPMLKDAGIGGTVMLWVFIDESGTVKNTKVVESSGYAQLDEVAQQVLRETASFSPAQNRDQRVPVWVKIPVTFQMVK